jgi:hypothetical protein
MKASLELFLFADEGVARRLFRPGSFGGCRPGMIEDRMGQGSVCLPYRRTPPGPTAIFFFDAHRA